MIVKYTTSDGFQLTLKPLIIHSIDLNGNIDEEPEDLSFVQRYDLYYLINYCNIMPKLHNPFGPAILKIVSEEYYLNGKAATLEEINKIKYNISLEKLLE